MAWICLEYPLCAAWRRCACIASGVFSLNLDAPPRPDEEAAQLVRLRSQQHDARPAGVVDDLIRQIQARQRSAAP
ncbi:MAG TPA: hypothetical protein VIY29_13550, partial [Ktedonobacteraceae bacterium]